MHFFVHRYGEAEVASWYFEVWNEPNVPEFWTGDMEAYFRLYQHTAGAIKEVLPEARVGGPATAGGAWLAEMREFCARHCVPLDFVSTNHYPGGDELSEGWQSPERRRQPGGRSLGQVLDTVRRYRQAMRHVQEADDFYGFIASFANREKGLERISRGSLTEEVKKARALAGDIPLIYTEWNAGQGFCSPLADELYPAAFIVKTIVDNEGYVDGYSFWTFSDLFEELTMFGHMPFAGTFGLLTKDGIPKPSFWAYKLLSELGDERYELDRTTSSRTLEIAAFRKGADLQILIYNQAMPGEPVETEHIELDVVRMPALRHVRAQRVDETHGNPKPLWEAMGAPQYLTQAQASELKGRSWIATEELPLFPLGERVRVAIDVPPHGVALLTCSN
jgi:xylan 1,4-beta-xylosidase